MPDVTQALLQLRDVLDELLDEDDWRESGPELMRQFERLERAATPEDRKAAVDDLIVALTRFEALHGALRNALRAGVGGGRRRGGFETDESWIWSSTQPELAAEDGPSGEMLERWPHLDLGQPEPVAAGSELVATVYVDDDGPGEGETSTPLALPADREIRLRVLLVTSHHFEIDGDDAGWITLAAGAKRSTTAEFHLRVGDGAAGVGVVTAFLVYDGRPAGSVHRQVKVGEAVALATPEELPAPIMSADLSAARPDLTVMIAPIPGSGGSRYACTVSTPHLREYADGVTEDWDLPDQSSTRAFVMTRMAGFTRGRIPNDARRAALVGAGLTLFEAAPENFKRVYWKLRNRNLPLGTIFVVSSEPYVPWELMIPARDGNEDALPIGVTSSVGRWVHAQHVSPRQPLALRDSYVIAPSYTGSKRLSFSADEARYVCETFDGREISPALFATIEATLGQRGAALLHLICHGADEEGGGQAIDLDPDEILTDGMLRGMPNLKAAVRAVGPLVFINACQVGRLTPALVGTGGFAAAFIALGAQAVIAPIWSVKDAVAANAAREFYNEVRARPGRPFARILRDIRRRAYEGSGPEDSWAAYCFYGDPLTAAC